jgi:glutathione S-transferase
VLILYHAPGSFSSRILWLLEELGADYRIEVVSYPEADGSNADPRNPHPHGYTPALAHQGQVVTETGAIALYLTTCSRTLKWVCRWAIRCALATSPGCSTRSA